MRMTLKEIAELVGGEVVGDAGTEINGVSGIKEAKKGDITFLANSKYSPLLDETQASAVIVSKEVRSCPRPLVRTDNPSLSFAKVVALFSPSQVKHPQGIHPSVVLGKDVKLGKGVSLGAYTVVEEGVSVGDNTTIYPSCYIGHNAKIGKDTLIYPHVSVREAVDIGSRVVIHSGSVIGSDGFGFASVQGLHQRIPQIGIVVIEDDVEIGANVTIDRARFEKTVIGKGTKIDNLVQIAHNVVVGENSIIVAQAGISGSTVIGKNVILAGQSGLVGHITLGDNVVVMAQSGVSKSIPANTYVWGYPAKEQSQAKKVNACVQRLPHLYEIVEGLKKKIQALEEQLKKK
ncbi:MAG: UDP-3-O-(3-hydroxymyristoyl)glucosamine N-acyltransferase [Candidatus Omnitrophica bacterium]|nr:UDP-3-O-(3-hydroxymyristoyl)glucosamine N-acyltransferase [Candidatus Omnitrophota bacterium]